MKFIRNYIINNYKHDFGNKLGYSWDKELSTLIKLDQYNLQEL